MFKDALRQLRIDQGISQEKLGEILDVSRQSISKYESGLSEPDFDKLIMIAEYFDVTTDFLLMSKINNQMKTRSERTSISSKMGQLFGGDGIASFYKFKINRVIGSKRTVPQTYILGTYDSGIFGDKNCLMAYYKTYADAKNELNRIDEAMEMGKTSYDLQYYVNLKSKGLDYVIDDN